MTGRNQTVLYHPEEPPALLHLLRSPKLLKDINGTQSLCPRLSNSALLVPSLSLQPHRKAQIVWDIDPCNLARSR